MKYLDEYRDPGAAREYARALARLATRPWTLMEVCGGQTHAIVRYGVDELLPAGVELLHGPGCPVCVTPAGDIDKAIFLASRAEVILCSFGDMMRVPGSGRDLLAARARGGDVRMVYSPLDALELARQHRDRQVVFFAVGFETTAPATAMAVKQASVQGVDNFSLLMCHVRVPPAIDAIAGAPGRRVQGFLAAGHVCTIMGYREYEPLCQRHRMPMVVTGFEPVDLLQGVLMCVKQLEEGRAEVENQYSRVVTRAGNSQAQALIDQVFCVVSRTWRGIGAIAESGFGLRPELADFDAEKRFGLTDATATSPAGQPASQQACISGLVLQGLRKPPECPAFATRCTPEHPLGATMVSSEGACAAYYRYRR
jgi:hydrogenase expression/formation protein HypD